MMGLVLIVPAYNETGILEKNVMKLHRYLKANLGLQFAIVVSAYKYSEEMEKIGKKLHTRTKNIFYHSAGKRGRGIALMEAHERFAKKGDWVGYIDLDLPVKLEKFREVEKIIRQNNCDLIVGSRYGKGSIKGPLKRKILSQGYVLLANAVLFGSKKADDFQAGFKFWRKETLDEIMRRFGKLDERWFFDTQLVYYGQKLGKRVFYLPVEYKLGENDKTTVNSVADSADFFFNLVKFKLANQ